MEKDGVTDKFTKILKDIKSVKIQGATNVCKAGIEAYQLIPTKFAAKKIVETRPTEPLLQNSINILQKSKNKEETAKKILKDIEESKIKIAKAGAELIENDMNIYSHCHSSTVINILKLAKKQKKHFVVYTTEVEPLLQGRKTAKDLASEGIKVIVAPDLAADQLMKKCDLFFFGADAFNKTYVANKIGTSTLVKLAKLHNVKCYSCGVAMKFTLKIKIENRGTREVWDERSKNIEIMNPAFDKTKLKDLSGIICEHGVLRSNQFVKIASMKIKNLVKYFNSF